MITAYADQSMVDRIQNEIIIHQVCGCLIGSGSGQSQSQVCELNEFALVMFFPIDNGFYTKELLPFTYFCWVWSY
jgi:hypothetical protein